jgi:hypothetical protein
MNPDQKLKQQLQILGGILAVLLLFGDGFLLDGTRKSIKRYKSSIKTYTEQKSNYDTLSMQKESLQRQIEDQKFSIERLLEKFPSDENTENEILSILADITGSLIVVKEQRSPKKEIEWAAEGMEAFTVPKIASDEPNIVLSNIVKIAYYETRLTVRCNYFELLEFLHKLANQDIYIIPMDLKIESEPDIPYGIKADIRLISFGFEGFKELSPY